METRNASASPIVVGLGEVLWDVFPRERRPGGAPANVAFHARQLGLRGVVCSRVGNDEHGEQLLAYLEQHGLGVEHIQLDTTCPTGTVTVHTDRADSPSYTIHENVAWDHLEYTEDWDGLFRSAAAVCFGTLAQRTERNRETIVRCLDTARHALRVYDINLRPPHYARPWIEESLSRANVAKLNADEAIRLCPLLMISPETPRHFADTVMERYGVDLVVITRGAEGCLLISRDGETRIPGMPVAVADTVGAGDSFSAGVIFGLLNHWPIEQVGRFANRLAGLVAARPGAMPDLSREIPQLLARR